MKWVSRTFFSAASHQEVNSTWYPEIEEPIKSLENCSLVLYIPKSDYILLYQFSLHHLHIFTSEVGKIYFLSLGVHNPNHGWCQFHGVIGLSVTWLTPVQRIKVLGQASNVRNLQHFELCIEFRPNTRPSCKPNQINLDEEAMWAWVHNKYRT